MPIQGGKNQKRLRVPSTCKACGGVGHNRANPECPAKARKTDDSRSIVGISGGSALQSSSSKVNENDDYLPGSEQKDEANDDGGEIYLDSAYFDESSEQPDKIYNPSNGCVLHETSKTIDITDEDWKELCFRDG